MCLTWEIQPENVTLKCTVSCLQFQVAIYNPVHVEEGYCNFRHRYTECKPTKNSYIMYQDHSTNTTVLIIMKHIDDKINGPWRCEHGTNRGTATANITVFTKGTIIQYHQLDVFECIVSIRKFSD